MKKNIIFIGIILLLLGCFQTLGAEPAYPAWYSGFGLKAQVPLVYPFYIKLNDLTNVSVASPTDNYVLTYDAATKLWGAEVTANTDAFTVKIDAGATAGYLGVAYSDGVLRVDQNELTYVDGGDFITLGLADHDTARTALGLAIGTDIQAYDDSLTSIAGLTYVSGSFIALTAEDTYAVRTYAQTLADIGAAAASHAMSTHSDEDTYSINTSGSITTSGVGGLISGSAANLGALQLFDGSDHSTIFNAGAQAANIVYTLPVDDGDNTEVLQTDGSGVLSWVAGGGADAFTVKVDAAATAGYFGVAGDDGIFRFTENHFTMADGGDFVTLSLADHATARAALGLAIGTDVVAWDTDLDTYAGISPSANMGTFLASATFAAMMANLSGTATAEFSFNGYNVRAGHIALGTVGPNADIGVYMLEELTDTDNTEKVGGFFNLQAVKTTAEATSYAAGVVGSVSLDAVNDQLWSNAMALRGVEARVIGEAGSEGTSTYNANLYTSTTVADAGALTNLYGLYVSTPTVAGNKVTNEYGIYVADQNTGSTLNYAIYTGAGLVRFGGDTSTTGKLSAATYGSDGTVTNAELLYINNLNQNLATTSDVQHADIYHTGFIGTNYYDNGNSGASITIDWNNGNLQYITLTAVGVDITFTEPPHPGECKLWIIQDGTGSRTVDWEHEISPLWPGGVEPTLTTTAGAVDVVVFTFIGGTTYTGLVNLDFK